jgi:hypothetical protein
MTRMFLTISAAVVLTAASWTAWAGPNDGPKYPSTVTNKQYPDQRIMDHNNAAPRYPLSAAAQSANQNGRAAQRAGTGNAAVAVTRRPVPRSTHARVGNAPHG